MDEYGYETSVTGGVVSFLWVIFALFVTAQIGSTKEGFSSIPPSPSCTNFLKLFELLKKKLKK